MEPDVQGYLAAELAQIREAPRDDEAAARWYTRFSGGITALWATRAIDARERSDWLERAREAARLPRLMQRAHSGWSASSWGGCNPPETLPRFLRLVPAPDHEHDFYGGRLRIIGLELYDTELVVQWRLAPLPNVDAAFPDEAQAAERDAEGLPEEERKQLRERRQRNNRKLADHFVVTDDAGNTYHRAGEQLLASPWEEVGRLILRPAPPQTTSEVLIDALGGQIRVPLTDRSQA